MFIIGRLVFIVFLVINILIFALYCLLIDTQPAVSSYLSLTKADIQKAKQIIFSTASTQSEKTLQLSEKDINILVNHLLNRHIDSASKVRLLPKKVHIASSIDLSDYLSGRYINLSFDLGKQNKKPYLSNLTIGQIPINDRYATLLLDYLINHTKFKNYFRLAGQHIKTITLQNKQLYIRYIADQDTINQVRSLLAYPANGKILLIYQRKLAEIIAKHDKNWLLSLADLLKPLFQIAYQRSTVDNAIEENRHVIFVVSAYVNKQEWQNFLSQDLPGLSPPPLPVYIYKRTDLAQHFIASATLTSLGSSYLANLMGIKKEIKDADIDKGGSGFSFIDLAADRAGMYFGKMATSSPDNARTMQRVMSNIKDYTAFMPDVRDLPEQIDRKSLVKQYPSVDSAAAQEILQRIDLRIKASPIYKYF